jgi:hypothetical protein
MHLVAKLCTLGFTVVVAHRLETKPLSLIIDMVFRLILAINIGLSFPFLSLS